MQPPQKEKIFVNGLISKEVPETAPAFILGKLSMNIPQLTKFLADNAKYAVGGYLNVTILKGKESGKRYAELDLFEFNNFKPTVTPEEVAVPTSVDYPADDLNAEDIPF